MSSELKIERAALPFDLITAFTCAETECGALGSPAQYFPKLVARGVDLSDDATLDGVCCLFDIPREDRAARIAGWRERGLVPPKLNGGGGTCLEDSAAEAIASAQAKSDAIRAAAKDPAPSGALAPDMEQVAQFMDLVFRHADKTNCISIRGYDHDNRATKPVVKDGVGLDSPGLFDRLESGIRRAANYPPSGAPRGEIWALPRQHRGHIKAMEPAPSGHAA